MSDWWHSNPSGGGWFGQHTPHWKHPNTRTERDEPAGWFGTYRPHWQRRHIPHVEYRERPRSAPDRGTRANHAPWPVILYLLGLFAWFLLPDWIAMLG